MRTSQKDLLRNFQCEQTKRVCFASKLSKLSQRRCRLFAEQRRRFACLAQRWGLTTFKNPVCWVCQTPRGDLMSGLSYSGTLSQPSLLGNFVPVSDPSPNLIFIESKQIKRICFANTRSPIDTSEADPFGLFANK